MPPGPVPDPTEFEIAIELCGVGLFNVLLFLAAFPCIISTLFETSALSFILPVAECDLSLTLNDKGRLNAVAYLGMALGALPSGFVSDTWGRKKILVGGLLIQGLLTLFGSTSQTVTMLLICKFFSGFVACGPFATILTYLSEMHAKNHRARVILFAGAMTSASLILLPVLAYLILPLDINLNVLNYKFSSWNVFLAVTSIPNLLASFLFCFFPESPKFYMAHGRNADALKAFRMIYKLNNRKETEPYPVKNLVEEAPELAAQYQARAEKKSTSPQRSMSEKLHDFGLKLVSGFNQIKPLFLRQYIGISLMVYSMVFLILLGQNSLRLWQPQLFASIAAFKAEDRGDVTMCAILDYIVNKTKSEQATATCEVKIRPASFINNIIVASTAVLALTLTAVIVKKTGHNIILKIGLAIATLLALLLAFAPSALIILILLAVYTAHTTVCCVTVFNVTVNLFPTTMRTMVLIMSLTFGRCGASLGNILLPILIATGCLPPFLMLSTVIFCAWVTSVFLPDSSNVPFR